ncbi:2-succinyl-5-enolpyruvyl-6-hydroxy-3-cyclohexene-1-carboxylic-acid synthase [Microbacterium gorillae]|uniref:2-succinyl-5-enolpyruvyl-6-hydroxy-3- cyclohexene-1-carboxylic-acid synthase n=1 Tax=Microbacterium gorillae TaxID=1231063 RepID=UPI00058BFECA|nr:2-succinyl-5-enolpyruvyl-6-hydroxy-3-cyclohexene-1-carboxylic-acid synthase [Microbacterium gorillae]
MPATAPSPATHAVAALLDELVVLGVEHLVVCPGSRSQALALTAVALERDARVRVHVRLDERSAGFLALGLGRATGRPAAVIVTSGTAVANLAPAVLEAHHSGIPLLLLTADRPPELRGVGANQATTQPGMFAAFVRDEVDAQVPVAVDDADTDASGFRALARRAFSAASAVPAGPVHVNLPLREPLAGALPGWWGNGHPGGHGLPVEVDDAEEPVAWADGAPTIVLAGADAGPDAVMAAERFGWPLLAEIVSGARRGRNAVPDYRARLRAPELGGAVRRVVVYGHPTLTREGTRLLQREDVDVIAVRGPGESIDLNHRSTAVSARTVLDGAFVADGDWLARWLAPVDPRPAPTALDREALVSAVWDATAADDRVVFGSSRLVRVADDVLAPKAVAVHANRGLAGIDGLIATASGIALGAGRGVTRLVLGDLSFLHDVGSLLMPADEAEPRLQVIVGNDGGGTIFDTLEVAQVADPVDFARVQYTPHRVRLADLARAYGWAHRVVTTVEELREAVADPPSGRQIVEVPLPR